METAQLTAKLAELRLQDERLDLEWAMARHGGRPEVAEDIEVKRLKLAARILEIEERMVELQGVPVPVPAPIAAQPAEPEPEYLDTRGAARILGISPRTLEGLRARGEGPTHIRIGKRVLYPVSALRSSGK